MGKVVVYGDSPEQLASAVAAARSLDAGAEVIGVTLNVPVQDAFNDCGAARVMVVQGAPCAEACAGQVADMLRTEGAECFIAAAGYNGQTLAALAAGLLEWPMESDAAALTGTLGEVHVTRLLYGGAVTREEVVSGPVAVTVAAGLFDPAAGPCQVQAVEAVPDARITVESIEQEQREGADITKARRVVGIGMGLRDDSDLQIARHLADALGAEVGGTRGMAEERGWLPDYIGISGLSIQPDLYLSLAVAGQVQHVFGIRGSKVIAAVNKNPDAPIFKAADYGIVGDFREVAPAIIAALR